MNRKSITSLVLSIFLSLVSYSGAVAAERHRILVTTDIGGTDADDNQSMAHLLMYNDLFDIEALVSTPSFGSGSKSEILRMIDVYEKDYPRLSSVRPVCSALTRSVRFAVRERIAWLLTVDSALRPMDRRLL